MSSFPFSTKNRVRFRDVDAMGLVNHAVLISFLEEARTEYLMNLLDLTSLEDIDFLIANVNCDFRSPARYGDILRTHVRISGLGDKSFRMQYEIHHEEEERLVAEAETVQVFYDYEKNQSMPVPDRFRKSVENI